MLRPVRSLSALIALAASGCGSSDQKAIEVAVAEKLQNPPNLTVDEPVIFREGEARLACMTAQWDNNWGERQPPVRLSALYKFDTKKWIVGNYADNRVPCSIYTDPDWEQKAVAAAAESRRRSQAQFDVVRQDEVDKSNTASASQASQDAEEKASAERNDRQRDAADAKQSAQDEATYRAESKAANEEIDATLKRGPVNNQ